jgi:hypothetical protein
MALADPRPGDGAYHPGDGADGKDPVDSNAPVPGGLSPTRDRSERHAVADADTPRQLLAPQENIDVQQFPTVHRLAAGLAEDRWEGEFDAALQHMLDRIEVFLRG